MRLRPLIKLPTAIRVTSWVAHIHKRLYNRLLRRLFSDWILAVWEVPGADRQIASEFMALLDRMYDRNDHKRGPLQQMVVFTHQSDHPQLWICGAFSRDYWAGTQQVLNKVAGVERTFVIDPTILIAQALTGSVDMRICYDR